MAPHAGIKSQRAAGLESATPVSAPSKNTDARFLDEAHSLSDHGGATTIGTTDVAAFHDRLVTTEPGGQAFTVCAVDGESVEEEIPCRLLEERIASRSAST